LGKRAYNISKTVPKNKTEAFSETFAVPAAAAKNFMIYRKNALSVSSPKEKGYGRSIPNSLRREADFYGRELF
jgi:hypothetical protein